MLGGIALISVLLGFCIGFKIANRVRWNSTMFNDIFFFVVSSIFVFVIGFAFGYELAMDYTFELLGLDKADYELVYQLKKENK